MVESNLPCPPAYARSSPHVLTKPNKSDVTIAMVDTSPALSSRGAKKSDNVKKCLQCKCFLDESKYGTKQWQEDQLIICNKCILDISSDIRPLPVPFIDSISLITSSIQTTEGLKLSSPNAKIGTVTAT